MSYVVSMLFCHFISEGVREYGVSRHFQQYLSYFVAVNSIEIHRPATSH